MKRLCLVVFAFVALAIAPLSAPAAECEDGDTRTFEGQVYTCVKGRWTRPSHGPGGSGGTVIGLMSPSGQWVTYAKVGGADTIAVYDEDEPLFCYCGR